MISCASWVLRVIFLAGVLADQEPPELAPAGQVDVAAPLAALARPGEGHAGRGRKLALGQRPRLPQMLGG